MLDHQVRQTGAIEEDHTLRQMFNEVAGLVAEAGGRDEDTLACPQPDKAADESLHIRPTDGIPARVALGLNVNAIEPQPIFIDHTINAAVARPSKLSGGIFT